MALGFFSCILSYGPLRFHSLHTCENTNCYVVLFVRKSEIGTVSEGQFWGISNSLSFLPLFYTSSSLAAGLWRTDVCLCVIEKEGAHFVPLVPEVWNGSHPSHVLSSCYMLLNCFTLWFFPSFLKPLCECKSSCDSSKENMLWKGSRIRKWAIHNLHLANSSTPVSSISLHLCFSTKK